MYIKVGQSCIISGVLCMTVQSQSHKLVNASYLQAIYSTPGGSWYNKVIPALPVVTTLMDLKQEKKLLFYNICQ